MGFDTWKMLFWDHLVHVEYKNKGDIQLVLQIPLEPKSG